MNEMNPLLMMMMMNGGMGGGAGGGGIAGTSGGAPGQPAPSTMRDFVGDGPLLDFINKPKPTSPWMGSDSILDIAQPPKQSGWDQFGGWLNKMPADTRLMMGMQGLSGLANVLRGN